MNHSGNFESGERREAAANDVGTWVITDGAAGTRAQGLALAEAVGLPYRLHELRKVHLPLPRFLQRRLPEKLLLSKTELDPPLPQTPPRLVISVGKRSAPIALAIKQASGGSTLAVHIHDPKLPLELFDLVAIPEHDGVAGDNVVTTCGSLHSVTPEKLAQATARFAKRLEPWPRPLIAVLLGGKSNAFKFPVETGRTLGKRLAHIAKQTGGTLLITPSHRTPPDSFAALKQEIAGATAYIYEGEGENPYHAFLGSADAIVVTEDSVNMVTEAAGTGKPIYVAQLPGRSKRLGTFHAKMREDGVTRPLADTLEDWTYAPINDTEKVARLIRERLGL